MLAPDWSQIGAKKQYLSFRVMTGTGGYIWIFDINTSDSVSVVHVSLYTHMYYVNKYLFSDTVLVLLFHYSFFFIKWMSLR